MWQQKCCKNVVFTLVTLWRKNTCFWMSFFVLVVPVFGKSISICKTIHQLFKMIQTNLLTYWIDIPKLYRDSFAEHFESELVSCKNVVNICCKIFWKVDVVYTKCYGTFSNLSNIRQSRWISLSLVELCHRNDMHFPLYDDMSKYFDNTFKK